MFFFSDLRSDCLARSLAKRGWRRVGVCSFFSLSSCTQRLLLWFFPPEGSGIGWRASSGSALATPFPAPQAPRLGCEPAHSGLRFLAVTRSPGAFSAWPVFFCHA